MEQAVPYLIEKGLLSRRDLIRGDVRVEDDSRRNRSLRVVCSRGPSFFLKQPDSSDPSTQVGIRREAAHYRYFDTSDSPARLRSLTPRFHLYDPASGVLVIEYVRPATTLTQYLAVRGTRAQPGVAAVLARAVAAFQHAAIEDSVADQGRLQPHVPFGLVFTFPRPGLLRTVSAGQLAVIRLVQHDSDAWVALDAMRRQYRAQGLVHGDIRWDNVLVAKGPSPLRSRIRLIDWELAAPGDPGWDVGSSFAAFLVRCLCVMDPRGNVTPATLRSAFATQLPRTQVELRAFWRALVEAARLSRDAAAALLARSTRYCGSRLLQYAFEWSPADDVTPIAACFLQLGLNILRRPEEACRLVFGIVDRGRRSIGHH